jgi:hypothetical protein
MQPVLIKNQVFTLFSVAQVKKDGVGIFKYVNGLTPNKTIPIKINLNEPKNCATETFHGVGL